MRLRREQILELHRAETIAVGASIREVARLRRFYGGGRWRKMKAFGRVRTDIGEIKRAEIHWYEAHGVGRFEFKAKILFD